MTWNHWSFINNNINTISIQYSMETVLQSVKKFISASLHNNVFNRFMKGCPNWPPSIKHDLWGAINFSLLTKYVKYKCFWHSAVSTHWGWVTHICVSELPIIGSDNGLSPGRRQAIIWTNAGILLIRTLGINFSEILSEIHTLSFKKMYLKMSSGKWRPLCLGLNVLKLICLYKWYMLSVMPCNITIIMVNSEKLPIQDTLTANKTKTKREYQTRRQFSKWTDSKTSKIYFLNISSS